MTWIRQGRRMPLLARFSNPFHTETFRLKVFRGMIDSGLEGSGRGAARAEDAQGTPTQSHVSPSILVYFTTLRLII